MRWFVLVAALFVGVVMSGATSAEHADNLNAGFNAIAAMGGTASFPLTHEPGWPAGVLLWSLIFFENQVALAGLAAVALYYLMVWLVLGRGPRARQAEPRSEPPDGLSPAECRLVARLDIDEPALAAALLALARDRKLGITEAPGNAGGRFAIALADTEKHPLTAEEKTAFEPVFAGQTIVELDETRDSARRLNGAKRSIARPGFSAERNLVRSNVGWWIFGVAGAFGLAAAAILQPLLSEERAQMFLIIGLLIAPLSFAAGTIKYWRRGARGTAYVMGSIFVISLAALVFLTTKVPVFSDPPALAAVVALVIAAAMRQPLRARTKNGGVARDEVERYLDFLAGSGPSPGVLRPDALVALFERHLPYALALDMAPRWAASCAAAGTTAANGWSPDWYEGAARGFEEIAGMATEFSGDLTDTINIGLSRISHVPT